MSSIFTKIIDGELPSYKILETDLSIAILALDQINLGHVLVIPKKEVDHFFEVEGPEYDDLFDLSKVISASIKKVTGCARVGMAIQGFEVSHCHVHLIPLNSPSDFAFANGKKRSDQEMSDIQEKLIQDLIQSEAL